MKNATKQTTDLHWAEKVSLNCRIHPAARQAYREIAATTGFTQDQLCEIASACLFGVTSDNLRRAVTTVQKAIQDKNIDIPAAYLQQISR